MTYATFHVFIIAKLGGIDNSPNNVYNKYRKSVQQLPKNYIYVNTSRKTEDLKFDIRNMIKKCKYIVTLKRKWIFANVVLLF
mgnify:CR=1 FL=1